MGGPPSGREEVGRPFGRAESVRVAEAGPKVVVGPSGRTVIGQGGLQEGRKRSGVLRQSRNCSGGPQAWLEVVRGPSD